MGAGPPPYYFYIKRPDTGAGEGGGEGEGEGGEEHSIFSQVQAPRPGKQYAVRSKPPHSDIYNQIYSSPRTLGLTGDMRPPGPPNTT